MKILTLILITFTFLAYSDQVFWSYDLTQLPEGWSYTGAWEFDSTGANIDLITWSDNRGNNSIYPELLYIPEGSDSLTLYIPQFISGSGSEGFSIARIKLSVNSGESQILWERIYYETSGGDSIPVNIVLDVSPGDSLSFYFGCDVIVYGSLGCSTLFWNMWDLELTLHGDIQELHPFTWAGIKSVFY